MQSTFLPQFTILYMKESSVNMLIDIIHINVYIHTNIQFNMFTLHSGIISYQYFKGAFNVADWNKNLFSNFLLIEHWSFLSNLVAETDLARQRWYCHAHTRMHAHAHAHKEKICTLIVCRDSVNLSKKLEIRSHETKILISIKAM